MKLKFSLAVNVILIIAFIAFILLAGYNSKKDHDFRQVCHKSNGNVIYTEIGQVCATITTIEIAN